ncbi:MAG: hypothetical protein N2484_00995 [Clostridia bacterium]|nr:hypothetical protein [Clostridia bacterium]
MMKKGEWEGLASMIAERVVQYLKEENELDLLGDYNYKDTIYQTHLEALIQSIPLENFKQGMESLAIVWTRV